MKATAWVLIASLAAAAGCGRNEEPAGARPARAATVDVTRAATPTSPSEPKTEEKRQRPRCVFPMPKSPAPKAERASSCPTDLTGNLDLPRGHVTFSDAPGRPRVEVELARTPEARERGLMYRTSMPDDAGMLFSWSDEQVRSFWMRNTCLPLDMLFIDADANIVGILEQVPTLNEDSRRVPCPAAHVLELNAGWARAHGIEPGQRVKLEN